jgi:ABC-type bacteriocin/lantibiotic exporter with double-glycine peptidase domain
VIIGILPAIRMLLIVVVVAIIAGGLYYVINIKADLAVSEANNRQLVEATREQNMLIEQMKQDVAAIQKANAELQAQTEKQRRDVETLNSKFSKRDFGALAAEKPEMVEKLVNRGSRNALRCMELAAGAPLNDQERAAKTPMEANRECPSLIDSDYTAPIR